MKVLRWKYESRALFAQSLYPILPFANNFILDHENTLHVYIHLLFCMLNNLSMNLNRVNNVQIK